MGQLLSVPRKCSCGDKICTHVIYVKMKLEERSTNAHLETLKKIEDCRKTINNRTGYNFIDCVIIRDEKEQIYTREYGCRKCIKSIYSGLQSKDFFDIEIKKNKEGYRMK
jgi:hypothetical protein